MRWYGQKETFFEGFYKRVEKTSEIIDISGGDKDLLELATIPSIFGGIDTTGTNYFAFCKSDPKGGECFKIQEKIKDIYNPAFPRFSSGPGAFPLDKIMDICDIVDLFMKSKDEVRKVFNMIASLISIPMNIGFSKTCGEQNYNLSSLEKYYSEGLKIIQRLKSEEDDDEEEI